jgi:hypothetical protein
MAWFFKIKMKIRKYGMKKLKNLEKPLCMVYIVFKKN